MASNEGRINRPYRKASEYLVNSQRQIAPPQSGQHLQVHQENESLRQKVLVLTRKLERSEAEFEQSREYLENQLDLSHDREKKTNDQYKKLQSSYGALQAVNRELEEKVLKVINRLEVERDSMVKEINELTNKVTETRNALFKSQEENERLRKDCNLAVQLLKCNQASYQLQRTELPVEVQEKVNNYTVELQDYNEYINPYADASDSESDDGLPQHNKSSNSNKQIYPPRVQDNSVPVEFIAEALKKPENVHMNLEPSDYIQDPALHSIYKAQYTERKLIKPDYGSDTTSRSYLNNQNEPSKIDAGSPWEKLPESHKPANEESSPWELAPSRNIPRYQEDDMDDGSSAGAYGAYAVGPKRRPPKQRTEIYTSEPARRPHHRMRETALASNGSTSTRSASPSPERLQFREPAVPPQAGISSYFGKASKPSPTISSSSTSSSKVNSPLKVRDKESATKAETSSLLNQSESDDEIQVEITHYPSSQSSPDKSYLRKEKNASEQTGALLAAEDEAATVSPPTGEIDLEWEPEILPENVEEYDRDEANELAQGVDNLNLQQPKPVSEPQPDLLLSYTNEESPARSQQSALEDLLSYNARGSGHVLSDDEGFLGIGGKNYLPSPHPSGALLSEIVTNNPSLESFLMTYPPPPPKEFVSSDYSTETQPPTHQGVESPDNPAPDSLNFMDLPLPEPPPPLDVIAQENPPPTRVDEQIEVVDLDEEPRKRVNRRRNSFDHAQEFGNIMNL